MDRTIGEPAACAPQNLISGERLLTMPPQGRCRICQAHRTRHAGCPWRGATHL